MSDSQLILPGVESQPGKKAKKASRPSQYLWQVGSEPPVLGIHSLAKHDVLQEYLRKYVAILAARPEQECLKLTLVDGFAGGGAYIHPKTGDRLPGSPLIMLNAMAAAEATANALRRKKFTLDIDYIFIEKLAPTIEFLQQELSGCEAANKCRDRIHVLPGIFSEHLDKILTRVEQRGRSRRVIFVLDQYGFTDVRMSDLRTIFGRLPNAEVILTVAIDWLIDHWSEKARYDQILSNLGVDLESGLADQIKQTNPADWRPVIQNTLHAEFRRNSGTGYYTPFFIHSVDSHRAYWLLHFSGHSKARDAMQQLHWELENHFQHFGQPGLGMLGFDPRRVDDGSPQLLLPYEFDASARALTREALLEQIPRRIDQNGIGFADFFEAVVNETPATKHMLASHISELTLEKELEVWTSDGRRRRNGVQVCDDDIIRRPQQKIFLPS
jgi:three-Cys-motif partner protein